MAKANRPRPPRNPQQQGGQRYYRGNRSPTGERVTAFAKSIIRATDAIDKFDRRMSDAFKGFQSAAGASKAGSSGIMATITKGAESAFGSILAQKTVSKVAPSLISAGGHGAAGVSTLGATGAASAFSATGAAATAATPAVISFGAVLSSVVLPLTLIAAAATAVYVAFFKWEQVPTWIKPIIFAVSPLVLGIRLLVNAVNAALLPFRAMAAAASLAVGTITLIPRAILAIPSVSISALGLVYSATRKVVEGLASIGRVATSAGVAIVKGLYGAVTWLVQAPARAVSVFAGLIAEVGVQAGSLAARIADPMREAADGFAKYGNSLWELQVEYELTAEEAATFAMAAELTGQKIKDLKKIMPAGTAEFAAFREEAEAAGRVLSQEEIGNARNLTIAYQRLKETKAGLWNLVGSVVAPAIEESTELVMGAVRGATAWVREHKDMIATAWRIGSTAATVATVLGVLTTAVGTLGSVLTPLVVASGAAAAGFALWDTAAGRATRNLAGDVWDRYGTSVRTAWTTVQDYGKRIWSYTQGVVQGVTDAIRGGRLDVAARVVLSGLQVAWVAGLSELATLTGGAVGSILSALAGGNWSDAGTAAMGALQVAFLKGSDFLDELWTDLVNTADRSLQWIVDIADESWVNIINAADPVWLSLKDKFQSLVNWGKDVFTDLTGYAASFVEAIVAVAKPLGTVIAGLAMLSPVGQLAFKASAAALEGIGESAGLAGRVATKMAKAKVSQLTAGGEEEETPERKAELARRREAREYKWGERWGERQQEGARRREGREYEWGDRWAARQKQIADLEEQLAEIARRGDAASAERAEILQRRLSDARYEAEMMREAARMQGEGLRAAVDEVAASEVKKKEKEKAEKSLGTFSAAAAIAMWGGGTGENSIAREQLSTQKRIETHSKRAADAAEKRQERYAENRAWLAFEPD
jgi:hypothetical protein